MPTRSTVQSLSHRFAPGLRTAGALRTAVAAISLALLVAVVSLALPSAGLAVFVVGLAVLFALPYALVTWIVADLDPAS